MMCQNQIKRIHESVSKTKSETFPLYSIEMIKLFLALQYWIEHLVFDYLAKTTNDC